MSFDNLLRLNHATKHKLCRYHCNSIAVCQCFSFCAMATSRQRKLSLIDPDFSGLWSVARLGRDQTWWNKICGTIVISVFVYSWIGGCLMPFFIFLLFMFGYHTLSIILLSLILLPYIINIDYQPWICRIYMKYGACYFHGGTSQCLEAKVEETNINKPICAGVHIHGLLCIGYFLVCGIRFRAIQDVEDEAIRTQFADKLGLFENINIYHRLPKKGLMVGYLTKAPLFNLIITKITGCVDSSSKQVWFIVINRNQWRLYIVH